MALSAWKSPLWHSEELVNLEALRQQLTRRVAIFVCCASGVAIWGTLPFEPFPLVILGLLLATFGLGLGVQRLIAVRPALARFGLLWGLTGLHLAALALLPEPWLPFLGILLIFLAALLLPNHEFATAAIVGLAAAWLHAAGRPYPLAGFVSSLVLAAGCAWLVARTLYTALAWTWNTQQEADRLLEQARTDRGELSRTLKALDLAYSLLQRTQAELVYARRQAEEARQMKERFAANISHELRTPLNLILGFSEIMYLSPEVYGDMAWPPALRRDVYQVYRGTRHLTGMIDDVLDLSRFEMTSFTLTRELTPLTPFLAATADLARDLFPAHPVPGSAAVRFEVDIAPDLPAVEIDRTRIRQVLLNLLNNARSFTERGLVRLAAEARPAEVLVTVSDSGPGIPPENLENVFQEFYQVDTSLRRKHQGMGLGLALSKRFVEAHDGRIWAENGPAGGAVIRFTLPLAVEAPAPLATRAAAGPALARTRPVLLAVHTDPALAGWLARHLPEFDVIPAAGAVDEEVRLYHPAAVLCNTPPGPGRRHSRQRCEPGRAAGTRDLLLAAERGVAGPGPGRRRLPDETGRQRRAGGSSARRAAGRPRRVPHPHHRRRPWLRAIDRADHAEPSRALSDQPRLRRGRRVGRHGRGPARHRPARPDDARCGWVCGAGLDARDPCTGRHPGAHSDGDQFCGGRPAAAGEPDCRPAGRWPAAPGGAELRARAGVDAGAPLR